jgi:hypothetical protein
MISGAVAYPSTTDKRLVRAELRERYAVILDAARTMQMRYRFDCSNAELSRAHPLAERAPGSWIQSLSNQWRCDGIFFELQRLTWSEKGKRNDYKW